MPTATVTSKGQITIPKEIRDSLKLKAGHKIDFTLGPNGEVSMRAKTKDFRSLMGKLYRRGTKPASVEEMDKSIREHVSKGY